MPSSEILLSVIATVLASLSFGREIWRTWRDRPKLSFYINAITLLNVPHFGDVEQIRIMICNIGYRPIILVRFRAFSERGSFSMGINDEPAAALGIEDQRFPASIEPGQCLKIHPLALASLKQNQTDDGVTQFDPWRVFVVEDSFGHLYPMDIEDVKRALRIGTSWKSYRGLARFRRSISTWMLLRRSRNKWSW